MPRRRVNPRVAFVVRIVIMLVFLGAAVFAAVEHAPAPAHWLADLRAYDQPHAVAGCDLAPALAEQDRVPGIHLHAQLAQNLDGLTPCPGRRSEGCVLAFTSPTSRS